MQEKSAVILADPEGGTWDFAKKVYARLSDDASFSLGYTPDKCFPDGEFRSSVDASIRGKNCFFIHDSSMEPSRWLMKLGQLNQILRTSSADQIIDILPYLRWARQDRKDRSRAPITARLIPHMVLPYADRVVSLEIHNPAIQGYFDPLPFDHLYSSNVLLAYLKKNHPELLHNLAVASPDSGGGDRAKGFARLFENNGVIIGYKERDSNGKVDRLYLNGSFRGKDIIVIDDILDSGGTLIKAYNAAKEGGANRVYAFCSHALFTKGIDDLVGKFDRIFVGDTLPLAKTHEKIEVVPFDGLFAEAIKRIHYNMSLTDLFENQGLIDKLV